MIKRDLLSGRVNADFALLEYRVSFLDRSGYEYEAVTDPRKKGVPLSRSEKKKVIDKYKLIQVKRNHFGSIWIREGSIWHQKWSNFFVRNGRD